MILRHSKVRIDVDRLSFRRRDVILVDRIFDVTLAQLTGPQDARVALGKRVGHHLALVMTEP